MATDKSAGTRDENGLIPAQHVPAPVK
jgi:hypothetical protein